MYTYKKQTQTIPFSVHQKVCPSTKDGSQKKPFKVVPGKWLMKISLALHVNWEIEYKNKLLLRYIACLQFFSVFVTSS